MQSSKRKWSELNDRERIEELKETINAKNRHIKQLETENNNLRQLMDESIDNVILKAQLSVAEQKLKTLYSELDCERIRNAALLSVKKN